MTIAQQIALFLSLILFASLLVLGTIWRELPKYPWWPRILGGLLAAISGYLGIAKLIELSRVSMSHGSEGLDPFSAVFIFMIFAVHAIGPAAVSIAVLAIVKWTSPKDEC